MDNKTEVKIAGLAQFFVFAIPAILGVAFSVWLGAYIQAHEFFHILSMEQRAAIYVAAPQATKEPVKIEVRKPDCIFVQRVDLDGSEIIIYGRNDCGHSIGYMEWHWQEKSPNGIVIGQDYTNFRCPIPYAANEVAECRMHIENPDVRTNSIQVWATTRP